MPGVGGPHQWGEFRQGWCRALSELGQFGPGGRSGLAEPLPTAGQDGRRAAGCAMPGGEWALEKAGSSGEAGPGTACPGERLQG